MLANYFDQISDAITEAYPSIPRKDSYAIILNCITNDSEDPAYSDAMVDITKKGILNVMETHYSDIKSEADIAAITNQYKEGGSKGTRSGGSHTLIP